MSIASFYIDNGIDPGDPDSLDAFLGGLAHGSSDGAWAYRGARAAGMPYENSPRQNRGGDGRSGGGGGSGGEHTAECSRCGRTKKRCDFSRTQWQKSSSTRKCNVCTGNAGRAGISTGGGLGLDGPAGMRGRDYGGGGGSSRRRRSRSRSRSPPRRAAKHVLSTYKCWEETQEKDGNPRYTHMRDSGLFVKWWPTSKKRTVFCQSTGFSGQAYSVKELHQILDQLASRAVVRR